MQKMDSVGAYTFKVEPFHVDYTGKLSFGILGNQLLNAAGCHAEDRGFGKQRLHEEGYTWVISRLTVEMYDYPAEYEDYTVETWIEGVSHYFTNRNFAILNKDGRSIGYARSIWALINIETREPVNILQMHDGALGKYISERECPISKTSRAHVTTTTPVADFKPLYCDIDYNGHLNSIKYVEHMLNYLPLEEFRRSRVHRMEICYSEECFYNEPLQVFVEKLSNEEYDMEIRKDSGNTACRGKIFFEAYQ